MSGANPGDTKKRRGWLGSPRAARDLTSAAAVGALSVDIGDRYPLEQVAEAHDRVDDGARGRILVTIPD